MTSNLTRSFSIVNSCINLRLRSQWSLTGYIARRYVQEFPSLRLDNSVPKDYLLVLPEKIEDKPENNELLRIPQKGEPEINFTKLNVEYCFKGLSQVICAFDNYLTDAANRTDLPYDSIQTIFKDIEKNLIPLDYAHNIFRIVMIIDEQNFRYKEVVSLLQRYANIREKRMEGILKEKLQEIVNDCREPLSPSDKTMLRIYEVSTKKRSILRPFDEASLFHLKKNLEFEKKTFIAQMGRACTLFSHTIDDPDILAAVASEFDDSHGLHHKERTPLEVTTDTFHRFMRVCPDRFVREGLWKTFNKRCSPKDVPKHNNMGLLNNMRVLRRKIADMKGYRTHLEYRLEDTMAGSKERIMDSLTAINMDISGKLAERLLELNEFAFDNSFSDPDRRGIREYDVDYWLHRYMYDVLVGVSDSNLKSYFPFENVMQGLKNYFSKYFSIDFKVKPISNDILWREGSQFIELTRNGETLGSIIYDPFLRSYGRPNIYYARIRSRVPGAEHLPARFISTSFNIDSETGKTNLSVSEVINLFYCFSTVIQRFLYNYEYYELNTYGALQPDVKNLLPNLCIGHILTDHKILQSCSHRSESKPIDSELSKRILRAQVYSKPFKTWFELYKAHLDIEANTTLSDTKNIADQAYSLYSPFPKDPENYDYCTMNDIFVGPLDGLYYTDLWSKQVANFCLRHLRNDDGKLDDSRTKEFYEKLIESLFDPINFDTSGKLVTLIGENFEPSKTGLGVL